MKYQNNRKELDKRLRFITARVGSTSENEIIKNLAILSDDFLAQKEDRKEWQKEILLGNDVGSPDGDCKIYGYWDNKTMVITRIEHTKPTPSPLEIEEIEEISDGDMRCLEDTRLIDKLWEKQCQIIRNQKKLYQYIKENKI